MNFAITKLAQVSPPRRLLITAGLTSLLLAGVSRAEAKAGHVEFFSSVDAGFGALDEDGFVLALIEQGFAWPELRIRLAAPLRFRVVDRSPDDAGGLRREDWDEVADFGKILKFLEYKNSGPKSDVRAYLGALSGIRIGHGALVDMYFNSLDLDHYQTGLTVAGDWQCNGVEFLTENLLQPELFAGRIFLSPIGWFSKGPAARNLELGFSLGADITAPRRITSSQQTRIVAGAIDISYQVVEIESFALKPYFEVGAMDGDPGIHIGLETETAPAGSRGPLIALRGEFRYLGPDYHPAFFNPFYDYNRFYYGEGNGPQTPTFADHLADLRELPARAGGMVDLAVIWEKGVRLGARYDTEGVDRPHWVLFRFELFPWRAFSMSAFYAGQDIVGGRQVFDFDSLIGFAFRARIWGPLDLFGDFTRRLRDIDTRKRWISEFGGGLGCALTY